MEERYSIVIDTNMIHEREQKDLSKLFKDWLPSLVSFINEKDLSNVRICIPEVVIEERVNQRALEAEKSIIEISTNINRLKGIVPLEKCKLSRKQLKTILINKAHEYLKNLEVSIIPLPVLDSKDLMVRAIDKIPPFSQAKEDKGIKDTLIWVSLLNDAKINQENNYFLFTSDKEGFKEDSLREQFNIVSKKKFFLCANLTKLKELLDRELKLNLNLQEERKKLEVKLNPHWQPTFDRLLSESDYALVSKEIGLPTFLQVYRGYSSGQKVESLKFSGIDFEDISPEIGGVYNLKVTVHAQAITRTFVPTSVESLQSSFEMRSVETPVYLIVKIIYNLKKNEFNSLKVTGTSPNLEKRPKITTTYMSNNFFK